MKGAVFSFASGNNMDISVSVKPEGGLFPIDPIRGV